MSRTTHYNLNKPTSADAPDISLLNENMDTIDGELYSRVKKWNGISPDETGNVTATTIQLAENFASASSKTFEEEFIIRTSGGSSSLNNGGSGTIEAIHGGRTHTGYSAAVIAMSVSMASRSAEEAEIVATMDRDAFLTNKPEAGTITVAYTSSWAANPSPPSSWSGTDLAYYGLTVTGEAKSGDTITITYTEEVPGTITQSTPMTFVSTGWNLYNHSSQCAIVTRYSEVYGYKISGDFTALRFSATVNGSRTTITPDVNNKFNVPSAGYIWVTGGNNSNTAIWATWEDWTNTYPGEFEIYHESVVDISDVMSTYFPDGLMRVGNYWDEINLSTGKALSVIQKQENDPSGTNLAAAKNSGRPYEYDANYVYSVKQSATEYTIPNIDNTFTPDDHGMEFFTNTDAPANARTIYGVNLKNKLERDVLSISAQQLTADQMLQVQKNLGVPSKSDFISFQTSVGVFNTVTDVTGVTVTKSSGSANMTATDDNLICKRCGNMVFLQVSIKASGAISANVKNLITLAFEGIPKPVGSVRGAGNFGYSALYYALGTDRKLAVRFAYNTNAFAENNVATLSMYYFTDE